MLSDRKASELISKSLREALTGDEASQISQHLEASQESRAFGELCKLIQSSALEIATLAEAGDGSVAPPLSDDSKRRLRDSIRKASTVAHLDHEPPSAERFDVLVLSELLAHGEVSIDSLAVALSKWDPSAGPGLTEHLVQQDAVSAETAKRYSTRVEVAQDSNKTINFRLTNREGRANGDASYESRTVTSQFSFLRKIGEGGLGEVWLARDENLQRNVAIKQISGPSLESPKAWQRFQREAEITSHLEHPNVVPLYQYGNDSTTGQPFYAMRFLGKHTLADAIIEFHETKLGPDERALELHRLLSAFLDVCQAIGYAHSRGVIHRDLKPENIALNNFGQVVVLDWGLAKLTDDAELGAQLNIQSEKYDSVLAYTMAGEVVGTPLYMAPEQAAGDLDNIDRKTDVYGLGAILFAILTGCAPHEKSNTSGDGQLRVKELLKSIADSDTPSPRAFNPCVPLDLESICMKAMARRRHARHASAAVLANEVERWIAGQREKQQHYDTMRMEGRELRARLQGAIRDLTKNTRFVSNLPPIQGIINAKMQRSDESLNTWRERLTTILRGLLQANADYMAIAYGEYKEEQAVELVRVERHSTDFTNIRAVPASRLVTWPCNERYVDNVMKQKPEEAYIQLRIMDESEGGDWQTEKTISLCAGVPVFDRETEEPFGLLVIKACFHRILEQEMSQRVAAAHQIAVLDFDEIVWLHHLASQRIATSEGKHARDLFPGFDRVDNVIRKQSEFIDEHTRDIYAARMDLMPGESGLILLLGQ